jgi:hypothetical protein
MYSGGATRALPRVGFPIRTSRHHWLVSTSTGLIAAAHVLHRLLAPRHPPCALIFLIRKNTCCCHYGVFKVHAGRCPQRRTAASKQRSLKTQQRENVEVDVLLGDLVYRTIASDHQRARSLRSNSSGFPRKEVIQPQLPLRLPCYDFTPVTNPTFDGSLPCGLGHRLRVLPASVV